MTSLRDMATPLVTPILVFALSPAAASAQDCTAALAQTEIGVTRLGPNRNPRLYVSGDFHTGPDGPADELRDLAFVSTITIENRERHVLSVLLSTGSGCFLPPPSPSIPQPPVLAGDDPRLIAAGKLDRDAAEDMVIIDAHVDQFNRRPKLRILLGAGRGQFKPGPGVSVFTLDEGEKPVAMAVGPFRGPNMPLDIAVVSIPGNSSATSRGVLKVLFNNGKGEFDRTSPPIPLGDFEPAAMAASDKFRGGGKYDLVIKEVAGSGGRRRILYLKNSGNGDFPDIAAFDDAGNVPSILLGVLQSKDTAGDKLDVITFDDDMTLKIFVNDGLVLLCYKQTF